MSEVIEPRVLLVLCAAVACVITAFIGWISAVLKEIETEDDVLDETAEDSPAGMPT